MTATGTPLSITSALNIKSTEVSPHRWHSHRSLLSQLFLDFLLPFSLGLILISKQFPKIVTCGSLLVNSVFKLSLYSILAISKCFCGLTIQYAKSGVSLTNDTPPRTIRKIWEYLHLWRQYGKQQQESGEELKEKRPPGSSLCLKTQIGNIAIATGNMKVKRKLGCCFQKVQFGEQRKAQKVTTHEKTCCKWKVFPRDEGMA